MITTVDLFGKKHTIVLCEPADGMRHFRKVKTLIPKEEREEFKLRMDECIEAKTAFTLSDNSCFLYYTVPKPGSAEGVALYGKSVPAKLLALFAGIFGQKETEIYKLDFKLHEGKFADEYRSIINPTAAAKRLTTGQPLSIRIDKLKEKVYKLYDKRGIKPNG